MVKLPVGGFVPRRPDEEEEPGNAVQKADEQHGNPCDVDNAQKGAYVKRILLRGSLVSGGANNDFRQPDGLLQVCCGRHRGLEKQ